MQSRQLLNTNTTFTSLMSVAALPTNLYLGQRLGKKCAISFLKENKDLYNLNVWKKRKGFKVINSYLVTKKGLPTFRLNFQKLKLQTGYLRLEQLYTASYNYNATVRISNVSRETRSNFSLLQTLHLLEKVLVRTLLLTSKLNLSMLYVFIRSGGITARSDKSFLKTKHTLLLNTKLL